MCLMTEVCNDVCNIQHLTGISLDVLARSACVCITCWDVLECPGTSWDTVGCVGHGIVWIYSS